MPDTGGIDGQGYLTSLWGTFQQAAQAGADTSTLWSQLRQAAGTLPFGQQPRDASGRFISREAYGAQVLQSKGVGIAQVNAMRGQAGKWLSARNRLASRPGDQQITADSIFSPAWRTSGLGPANPPQYRLRILRGIGVSGQEGTQYTSWSTYDLGSNVGSLDQLIARANQAYGRQRYSSGTFINEVLDYEIEVI